VSGAGSGWFWGEGRGRGVGGISEGGRCEGGGRDGAAFVLAEVEGAVGVMVEGVAGPMVGVGVVVEGRPVRAKSLTESFSVSWSALEGPWVVGIRPREAMMPMRDCMSAWRLRSAAWTCFRMRIWMES